MPPEEHKTPNTQTTPPVSVPPSPASATPTPGPTFNSGVPAAGAGAGASGGSKTAVIFGIAAVLLIVAVLVVGWFMWWSPAARSANTANAFMKAISTGDTQKAEALASDQTADTKKFIEDSAADLKGTFKLSQSAFQQSKRYSLYGSTDAAKKYARVIVAQQSGKWLVNSLVFSNSSLKLVPDSSSQTTTSTNATTNSTACLVPSDYSVITNELDGLATNTTAWTADGPYTNNVHFQADSLNYDPTDDPARTLKGFADFYKANQAKSFKIHLRGSVGTTAASDLSFANQRAQKVSGELQADGVPVASIVVDVPNNVTNDVGNATPDTTDQATARNVVLQIIPTCSSDSSSTGR